jgi:hypothetical protein
MVGPSRFNHTDIAQYTETPTDDFDPTIVYGFGRHDNTTFSNYGTDNAKEISMRLYEFWVNGKPNPGFQVKSKIIAVPCLILQDCLTNVAGYYMESNKPGAPHFN